MNDRLATLSSICALLVACGDDATPADTEAGSGSTGAGGSESTGDMTAPGTDESSGGGGNTSTSGVGSSSSGGGESTTTGPVELCGNDVIDPGETCDGTDLGGEDCISQGFDDGELGCTDDCGALDKTNCVSFTCGNDLAEGSEACDGVDVAGVTCADLDPAYDSGTPTCTPDCSTIEADGCGTCGNVIVDGDEVCDNIVLLGQTCISQGFESGQLGCAPDCLSYETAGCGNCANGVIDGAEVCDGGLLAGTTCADLPGFDSGTLACAGDCLTFDTSMCGTCGNDIIDGTETCDSFQVGGETCSSLMMGFDSGTLQCLGDCSGFDLSSCGICGNGIVDGAENCDGMNLGGATCANIGLGGGTLACAAGCFFDFSGCDDQFGIACDPLNPANCFQAAFMADAGGVAGNLYAMSLDGTQTIDYGPIGIQLTGLAFHPGGTLYGVDPGFGQLVTIDPLTVSFSVVGPLQTAGGIAHIHIPDIAFMGTQLVGWSENGDDLVLIDHTTGIVTVVSSAQGSAGTALAYNTDTDEILLAPSGANGILYGVSMMGVVSAGPTLGGINGSVKGLSYYNGLLYGFDAVGFGGGGNFVTFDPITGASNVLAPMPSVNIDAIAVYDTGNLAGP